MAQARAQPGRGRGRGAPLKPPPSLTKEQSITLEMELIERYAREDFQRKLHEGFDQAAGDPLRQGKSRQEVCLEQQVEVLPKYGFEASRLGVCQSVAAYKPFHGHMDEEFRSLHMAYLINVGQQRFNDAPSLDLTGAWTIEWCGGDERTACTFRHEVASKEFGGKLGDDEIVEGTVCGSHLRWRFGSVSAMALVQDDGWRLDSGYVWQGTSTVLCFFTGYRNEAAPNSAPAEDVDCSAQGIRVALQHYNSDSPLVYGAMMAGLRAPSAFLRTEVCSPAERLMEYLREDPEGPFHGLVDEWPQNKKLTGRWAKFAFEAGGEQEPLLKADWHSVHNWGLETHAFVPRASKICTLRRAPRRLLAFMESFREVNLCVWTAVLRSLEALLRNEENKELGPDLPWLVDLLSRVMRKRGHFGSFEAQVWWGDETITTRSHKDGATSLMHLSLTLSGIRSVRVGGFQDPGAPILRDPSLFSPMRENVWDDSIWPEGHLSTIGLRTGSVYCSAPFIFEHGVMYRQCDRLEPVIAIQSRLAFSDLKEAQRVNEMRNGSMRLVAETIAQRLKEAGDRGELRLPTLQEVKDAEKAIGVSEAKFSAGRHEDHIFSELPGPESY